MATYNDVIWQPSGNRREGNVLITEGSATGTQRSGVIQRGDYVDYSGYANSVSGHLLPQFLLRVSGY